MSRMPCRITDSGPQYEPDEAEPIERKLDLHYQRCKLFLRVQYDVMPDGSTKVFSALHKGDELWGALSEEVQEELMHAVEAHERVCAEACL